MPQPWAHRTWIWVIQSYNHSLFHIAAALPLCKRRFPCLCASSCPLSCLPLAAFASCVFHAATMRVGRGASWAGAVAAIGHERWGSRAERQRQSPKKLDGSHSLGGGVVPVTLRGQRSWVVNLAEFLFVHLVPIFPRTLLQATGWTMAACANSFASFTGLDTMTIFVLSKQNVFYTCQMLHLRQVLDETKR